MAQTGYTPILIYGSSTAAAVPTNTNLTSSANGAELALNYTDGKLYYKDNGGTVRLLADKISVSVVSANGFAGTVAQATATSTPAITLTTSITGVLKGNGTAISAAVSGSDYAPATSGTSILKGNGAGGFSNATSGTDYAPATSGTSILYGDGTGGFSNVTIGSGISFAGGTLTATGTGGTVTAVSVATANGFAGTSSGGATPALTLTTSITGVLKGNGTAISAATSGTDYLAPPSGTAMLKANSGGALANATAGTDYVAPGGALGTPSSGTLSSCTVDGTDAVGFRNIPQNAQTGSYTLVLADSGKHIYRGSGSSATWTIPANSSVAYPVGTALTFINLSSTSVSIAITTDTMYLSSLGTTGTRTLAQYGSATAVKIASTIWIISGSGLT